MPDIIHVLSRWWKMIVGFAVLTTALATLILLFQEDQYLSTVTALPANSLTSDKSRLFNENIQHLYSSIGTSDELDRFEGTARLDTLYIAVSNQLGLQNHYKVQNDHSLIKKLKKNSRIARSEYGELKIKVWDKDPSIAAAIATGLYQNLQAIHQSLQNQNNTLVLQRLKEAIDSLSKELSSGTASILSNQTNNNIVDSSQSSRDKISDVQNISIKGQIIKEQLYQQQKLISEYSLAIATNPPALLVVENARPSAKPDRPKRLQLLSMIFFAALVFGFLLSLFLINRKHV
jgi:uncharacterized protein involved in exopolysaccharide biosynthesis